MLKIGESVVALIWKILESRTDLRNGLYFEVLSDSLETYPEMGSICKRLKLTMSGLGLLMRHLMY